jgi:hypothetical protein
MERTSKRWLCVDLFSRSEPTLPVSLTLTLFPESVSSPLNLWGEGHV